MMSRTVCAALTSADPAVGEGEVVLPRSAVGGGCLPGAGDGVLHAQPRPLAGNTMGVLSVAYSVNGQQVAAGGADKSLTVWSSSQQRSRAKVRMKSPANKASRS